MKKIFRFRITALMIAALLFSVFPMTVFAENEYTVTEMTAQGEITSDVNVRKGPGTDYDKIGTVRAKEIVVITGKSADGWYQIEYENGTGFIYGEYVAVVETAPADMVTEDPAEEEMQEKEGAFASVSGILKPIAVVVIIAVIIVMIFLTIRSLRQDDEGAEEEDDDYDYEEDEDDEEDYGYDGEDDDACDEEEEESEDTAASKKASQTIIIREEDYQLHIDPKYFEDEPIAQPDCVTGYLKKKQEQEEAEEEEKNKSHSGDIQKAMDKLQELQEELEKLKKKQE